MVKSYGNFKVQIFGRMTYDQYQEVHTFIESQTTSDRERKTTRIYYTGDHGRYDIVITADTSESITSIKISIR